MAASATAVSGRRPEEAAPPRPACSRSPRQSSTAPGPPRPRPSAWRPLPLVSQGLLLPWPHWETHRSQRWRWQQHLERLPAIISHRRPQIHGSPGLRGHRRGAMPTRRSRQVLMSKVHQGRLSRPRSPRLQPRRHRPRQGQDAPGRHQALVRREAAASSGGGRLR